jgi:hypothetical protein
MIKSHPNCIKRTIHHGDDMHEKSISTNEPQSVMVLFVQIGLWSEYPSELCAH